jgi:hypothetical protein
MILQILWTASALGPAERLGLWDKSSAIGPKFVVYLRNCFGENSFISLFSGEPAHLRRDAVEGQAESLQVLPAGSGQILLPICTMHKCL